MNLAESIAQYTVNSFASFLEEEATSVGTMGGAKTKGNGGKGKNYGGAKPLAAPAAVSAGRDDGNLPNDVTTVISNWGSDGSNGGDLNGDGIVDGADLTIALGRMS